MTAQAQSILREAMKLPPEERADVAAELLASLDDASEPLAEVETAWAEEIERRARRVLSGEAVGASWNEVREHLEDRLKKP
jgi:putative addiction module component (TIGR02574 family)